MSLRGAVTMVTGTTVSSALSDVSAAGIAAPAPVVVVVVVVVIVVVVGSVLCSGHSHDVTKTRAFPSRESRPVDDVTAQMKTGIRCSR